MSFKTQFKIEFWALVKNLRSAWINARYHKWRSYEVWFLRYKAQRKEFFVILDHFLSIDPQKSKFWKNEKRKTWRYYDYILLYQKWWSYDAWFATWSATDRIFCHFGPFFALLSHSQPEKPKFWNNEKNTWRYYHFTLVYHKWQSYDVSFLRYGARQTDFFVIWTIFGSFTPLTTQKIKVW